GCQALWYILRLDDDFHFSKETKISVMREILEDRPELGAIADIERQANDGKNLTSGEISSVQGFLVFDDDVLCKLKVPVPNWLWMRADGHRFAIANFTRNFLLIRRKVFANVRWNDNLIFQREHIAFMMDLQYSGWLLAFTPDSIHYHTDPKETSKSYEDAKSSEKGLERSVEEFALKYNITKVTAHNFLSLWGARMDSRPTLLRRTIQRLRKILSSPKK
ncbi:MAG: hypothetical protein R6U19_06130, partial [Bacteroidales bacterium]